MEARAEVAPAAQPPTDIKGPLSDPAVRESLADAFLAQWRRKKGYRKPRPKYVVAELASVAKYHPGAEGEYCHNSKTVTVRFTTPPLVLTCETTGATKDFGPFEVTMTTHQKPVSLSVVARALTPRPAVDSPNVTHPHVNGGVICMGDWKTVIKSNAVSGHFSVAADMILSLLSTYNPGSPYRRLDEWDGYACDNCGARVRAAPRLCGECGQPACSHCNRMNCGYSGSALHEDCVGNCENCGLTVAQSLLEDGRCPNCRGAGDEGDEGDEEEEEEEYEEEYEDEEDYEDEPESEDEDGEEVEQAAAQVAAREWRDESGQPCVRCGERFDPRGLFEGTCSYCYGTA